MEWNRLNNIEEEPFAEVLYREEDDYQSYNSVKNHIDNFINLEIGNKLNISIFDYLNLTKYEIELVTKILTDNLTRYNSQIEAEQKRLSKGIK